MTNLTKTTSVAATYTTFNGIIDNMLINNIGTSEGIKERELHLDVLNKGYQAKDIQVVFGTIDTPFSEIEVDVYFVLNMELDGSFSKGEFIVYPSTDKEYDHITKKRIILNETPIAVAKVGYIQLTKGAINAVADAIDELESGFCAFNISPGQLELIELDEEIFQIIEELFGEGFVNKIKELNLETLVLEY